jgi:toxin CptA
MDRRRDRPPILIRPRLSVRLAGFVLLSHGAALAAALALPGPWRLAALAVLASLGWQLAVHVLRLAPWSIRSMLRQPDGTWLIRLVSGTELGASLSAATFVSVPLIVLNLHRGPWRRFALPLPADALGPDEPRRLRQRLAIEGVGPTGAGDGDPDRA